MFAPECSEAEVHSASTAYVLLVIFLVIGVFLTFNAHGRNGRERTYRHRENVASASRTVILVELPAKSLRKRYNRSSGIKRVINLIAIPLYRRCGKHTMREPKSDSHDLADLRGER
jgi:hypothetical protein